MCSSAHADVAYTPAEEQALELALQAAVHAIDPSKGITQDRFCAETIRLLPDLDIPANPATLKPLMRPFVNQARDLCGMHLFSNKSASLSAPPRGALALRPTRTHALWGMCGIIRESANVVRG